MKKIRPNRHITKPAKKPKPSVRSYWLMKATGETEHSLWRGNLECGMPPVNEIAKLIGVPEGYVEHMFVVYKGKRHSMFVDENGRQRKRAILNWKASAIYSNATLHKQDMDEHTYNDLLEVPSIHPLMFAAEGLFIIGTALLWEGECSNSAPSEGPIPSFMEVANVKV